VILGPEFPSLLGGLIGLAIVTTAAKKGFLIPKRTWDFADSKDWPSEWLGSIEMKLEDIAAKPMSGFRAWVPYVLVGVVLVLSRTVEPIKQAFTSVGVSFLGVMSGPLPEWAFDWPITVDGWEGQRYRK